MSGKFSFDTFLTNLPESSGKSVAQKAPAAETGWPSSDAKAAAARPVSDIDLVMKALRDGAKTVRELAPILGNSVGNTLDTIQKLQMLGYVAHSDGDKFALTDEGKQAAESLE